MKKTIDVEKSWADVKLREEAMERTGATIKEKTGVRIATKKIDRKRIEEKVQYAKAKTKLIEERIISLTDELFESNKEREPLHVSVSVSCDFHKFLIDFGDEPPGDEIEYVADTIRSGMDWFYSLAFHCNGIRDDLAKWSFDQEATPHFRELREACIKRFEVLCSPSATAGTLLGALLSLIHLELVFMAQVFPLAVDSNLKENQWLISRT